MRGDALGDLLLSKRLVIYGHSHPGELDPMPSASDREVLRMIGQKSSRLISALSGIETGFTEDPFEMI